MKNLETLIKEYRSASEDYNKNFDKAHDTVSQLIDLIKNKKRLPDSIPDELLKPAPTNSDVFIPLIYFRRIYVNLIGFPMLTSSFINNLANYLKGKKVLEIMSGCGSLSYFLEEKGIECITTDNNLWGDKWSIMWKEPINIDAVNAIKKYGKDVDYIIMSWPMMDNTAFECLKTMRKVNPNLKMIYIGEGKGGCTADDSFFDLVDSEYKQEYLDLGFLSYFGIYDEISVIY